MTTIQLKTEIQKKLDQAPEELLADVLNFIELKSQASEKALLDEFLEQTFKEDKGLLEKLSQ
jgi:hypothetical protein